jgi:hypothetical protein
MSEISKEPPGAAQKRLARLKKQAPEPLSPAQKLWERLKKPVPETFWAISEVVCCEPDGDVVIRRVKAPRGNQYFDHFLDQGFLPQTPQVGERVQVRIQLIKKPGNERSSWKATLFPLEDADS